MPQDKSIEALPPQRKFLDRRALIGAGLVAAAGVGASIASASPAAALTPTGGVNVIDYGADPTGVANSSTPIANAAAASDLVYFPPGTYKIGTALTFTNSVTLVGAGNHSTILKTTSATANMLTFNANGWHVRDMSLDSGVTRTAGAFIKSGTTRFGSIENINLIHYYIGIDLVGTIAVNISNIDAADGTPSTTATGGSIIRLGSSGAAATGSINISGLQADVFPSSAQPSYGIDMGYVDVVSISDTLIIHHGMDINVAPKASQTASLIQITNSCLDTAVRGLRVVPATSGAVTRCGVANSWFGEHTSDGAVLDGSAGTIDGFTFVNCIFLSNDVNGLSVSGASARNIDVTNSWSNGNTGDGLYIGGNAQNITWTGGSLSTNTGHGFVSAVGTTGAVRQARLDGNTAGTFVNPNNVLMTADNTPNEWTTFATTATTTGGAFGAATTTFRYRLDGKATHFTCTVAIATNGAGAGAVKVPLPFVPASVSAFGGRESQSVGYMIQGIISSGDANLYIWKYDGTYAGASARTLVISGTFEIP